MDERRSYERIAMELEAEVEVVGSSPGGGIPPVTINGTLNSASPSGVGLELKRREPTLKPGKRVIVRFSSGTYKAELPGQVAWHGNPKGETGLGVELQLMLMPALSRHTYAQWITTRLQRDRDERRSRSLPIRERK